MDTKMKQFEPIDPLTIESDTRIFGKLIDHEATYRDCIYYFAIDDTHAIIAAHSYYTDPDTNESEWLTYQLEFPKAGLRWIVDTLTIKFVKSPEEGGLPGGVYHYEERSEEHTSELQSRPHLVCRLLLEKKKKTKKQKVKLNYK